MSGLTIHRPYEGEHVTDGSPCWCQPVEVGEDAEPPSEVPVCPN